MPVVKDVIVRKPSESEIEKFQEWPIWTGQISTFDWDYTQTETCLILKGEVKVTDRPAGEDSITFGPGDLVIFPDGLECIWTITQPVRKHYNFS